MHQLKRIPGEQRSLEGPWCANGECSESKKAGLAICVCRARPGRTVTGTGTCSARNAHEVAASFTLSPKRRRLTVRVAFPWQPESGSERWAAFGMSMQSIACAAAVLERHDHPECGCAAPVQCSHETLSQDQDKRVCHVLHAAH